MALHPVYDTLDSLRSLIDDIETEVSEIDDELFDGLAPINKKVLDALNSKLSLGAKNIKKLHKDVEKIANKLRKK